MQRNSYRNQSAFFRASADFYLASESKRPFTHSQKPEGLCACHLTLRNPAPIVLNLKKHKIFRLSQPDGHGMSRRMPSNIRKNFLQDPKDNRRPLLVQGKRLSWNPN